MTETPFDRARLDALLSLDLTLEGRLRRVRLRVPTIRDVISIMEDPHMRSAAMIARTVPVEIKRLIADVDGEQIYLGEARAIWNGDRAAALQILARRDLIYAALRNEGTLLARCPHCNAFDAALDAKTLADRLGAQLPPLVDAELFVAAPSLAELFPTGARPQSVALASRIGFVLPSFAIGEQRDVRGGELGDVDINTGLSREARAWNTFAPDDVEPRTGRAHWAWACPGFRAVLRLGVAIPVLELDAGAEVRELSPDVLEPLPAIDLFFLDAIYRLTHNIDVADGSPALLRCERCSGLFLPVRRG